MNGVTELRSPLDPLDRRLLNEFQRDFPLVAEPFAEIAARLGTDSDDVLARLERLTEAGYISRIGPVFNGARVGASTLAAMSVPAERLTSVARLVSQCPQVNHNYEREHALNLWFVVTAPDSEAVREVLDDIETWTGIEVLDLPLERPYHIDLGFKLW